MRPTYLILIAVAVAGLLAAQAGYYLVVYLGQRRRAELRRRLHSLADPGQSGPALIRERRVARSAALAEILGTWAPVERLEKLLVQTDLTWTVASTLGLGFLLGTTLTLVLALVLRQPVFVALVGLPVGAAIPVLIVLDNRMRRSQKLSRQLPDALDMMGRSLRAGHGIGAAFKLVAEEMPPPVSVEFGRVFEELKYGMTLRDTLVHMTERAPGNLDVRIIAVSLLLQAEVGGNLVEMLDHIGTTLRERFRFYGKLRALTAEGRLSGWILGALPFVCLLLVALIRPGYLTPLYADPIGRVIAAAGVMFWLLGVLWIRRLVAVQY